MVYFPELQRYIAVYDQYNGAYSNKCPKVMRMLYNGTHAQLLYMQVCKESATYFNAIHRSLMLNGGSLNEMMSPPVEAAEFKLII